MKNEKVLELIVEGQAKEHPILFSGHMVTAILRDQKTQTRRTKGLDFVNAEPDGYSFTGWERDPELADSDSIDIIPVQHYGLFAEFSKGEWLTKAPWEKGDVLWVRETWWKRPFLTRKDLKDGADTWPEYEYEVEKIMAWDETELKHYGWKRMPSIFMPKKACRIKLKVEGLRVERLQDITEKDSIYEGVGAGFQMNAGWPDYNSIKNGICHLTQDEARMSFASLWESINGKNAWDSNPFVWVTDFKRVVAN